MTSDAERLAQLLLELRMNAETLGKSLGKNDGDTIRNVLKGKYGLSAKLARAIADKYGVSFTWLRTGEGEMFAKKADPGLSSKRFEDMPAFSSANGDKDFIISQQRELIASQSNLIKKLISKIEELEKSR